MTDPYRYTLDRPREGQERWLLATGKLLWVMLNPSTATSEDDDPTIRKCVGFTRRWDFQSLTVVNLFAYRATKPTELWAKLTAGVDVVGALNDASIIAEAKTADAVVCAWGRSWRDPMLARIEHVLQLLWANTKHRELYCIGRNGDGSPTHPCMAAYVPRPSTWKVRKEAA